jgi:hypothetical protein
MPRRVIDDEDDDDYEFDPPQPNYSLTNPDEQMHGPEPSAPQASAFPIDALGPDVRALFEHLECAVCLDLQADMLVVCEGGHSMCKVCYEELIRCSGPNCRKCPSCRSPIAMPRPNLAVNGLVAAMGIKPRSAPPAPPAAEVALAVAIPVPVRDPTPAGQSARLRRSVISKLKVRVRKLGELRALQSRIGYYPRALQEKNHILNQVAGLGHQWRFNNFRPQNPPVRMSPELAAAFNQGVERASWP